MDVGLTFKLFSADVQVALGRINAMDSPDFILQSGSQVSRPTPDIQDMILFGEVEY